VDDLLFDRRTRPLGWAPLLAPLLLAAVPAGRLASNGHPVLAVGAAIGTALLVLLLGWSIRRSWTRVGPDGLQYFNGVSRTRTLAWTEVRWIGVRQLNPGRQPSLVVRVTRQDGSHCTLPMVYSRTGDQDPDFPRKVEQITACWHRYTAEDSRIEPAPASTGRLSRSALRRAGRKRLSRRLARHWQLLVALVALVGVIGVAANRADAQQAAQSAPGPVKDMSMTPPEVTDGSLCWMVAPSRMNAGVPSDYCSDEMAMTIVSATPPAGGRGLFRLTLADYSGGHRQTVSIPTGSRLLSTFHPGGTAVLLRQGASVVAVGNERDLVQTTQSPVYTERDRARSDLAQEVPLLAVLLLFAVWWVDLRARRARRVRLRFRWWVPCSVPAVVAAQVVASRFGDRSGPVTLSAFAVPGLLLVGGLVLASVLSRIGPRRAPGPDPIPSEWNPTTPQW
jgi:hypothetical protein